MSGSIVESVAQVVDLVLEAVHCTLVVDECADPGREGQPEQHRQHAEHRPTDRHPAPVTPGRRLIFSPTIPRITPMIPSSRPIQARMAVSTLNSAATPNTREKVAAALVLAGVPPAGRARGAGSLDAVISYLAFFATVPDGASPMFRHSCVPSATVLPLLLSTAAPTNVLRTGRVARS